MNERSALVALSSDDPDVVLKCLYLLGAERTNVPSSSVLDLAVHQLKSTDSDVRRQVAVTVGIHWAYETAFPAFVSSLALEDDEDVAEALVSAVARIARESPLHVPTALLALYRRLMSPGGSSRLRGLAYLEAQMLCGKMTVSEYAQIGLNPEKIVVDYVWFADVVARAACEPPPERNS